MMLEKTALISLSNLSKKYRIGEVESTVLNQISLSVETGEMLAVVGASGSGKSTLMNLMGLLDKPDSGEYVLHGQSTRDLQDDERAELRNKCFGFVFQQFNLLSRFTAAQNVALPLTYRRLSATTIQKKVDDALLRVGLQSFAAHRPTELSGGQQQRVAIARALVGEPRVILADEPTGALDSNTGREIMQLFLNLHQEGRTIIFVTHDQQLAKQCTRIISLVDGRIVSVLGNKP